MELITNMDDAIEYFAMWQKPERFALYFFIPWHKCQGNHGNGMMKIEQGMANIEIDYFILSNFVWEEKLALSVQSQ
ncbi:hypothetical protein [Ignavibacterium album]|nr:hypothetical protein [Ignavibacterium album]